MLPRFTTTTGIDSVTVWAVLGWARGSNLGSYRYKASPLDCRNVGYETSSPSLCWLYIGSFLHLSPSFSSEEYLLVLEHKSS